MIRTLLTRAVLDVNISFVDKHCLILNRESRGYIRGHDGYLHILLHEESLPIIVDSLPDTRSSKGTFTIWRYDRFTYVFYMDNRMLLYESPGGLFLHPLKMTVYSGGSKDE